ncbi:hypothetical protein XH98_18855 [Bradyrhizobium sp. CCBAU 51745]|uniref:hypothetical protein n=1 Tax=Bradyrhizobium sp. CCBAU 51745 TaxID=1325099 RepID=UPI002305682F|nr:hypothetical protein [Bradyrhizobium sp. CCBAU 51745]MDA9441113.1 hypothetical protein [Bradyrhizobium sp. CCBAU 51745]
MTAFCRAAPWLALALTLAATPALAASGPPPGFVLSDDADLAFTSPDGATKLEQYVKDAGDWEVKWQVWARRGDQMTELKPEQGYGAGFRFTADSQWLVRMQKTGSGEQDLFLYHAENGTFVSATRKSLSDLAWAYFYGRPETKHFAKLDFHISANLLKGTEEAYRWLGVDWPNNSYLVISLAGQYDKHPKNTIMKGLGGWQCRYDLKTGTFDLPEIFAKENAEALKWEVKRE